MALPNIFTRTVTEEIIDRINQLKPDTLSLWGKMNVAQMLAHCNVTYEMVYDDKHQRPNAFIRFILKSLVKNKVVNELPYSKNGQTAPQFLIKDTKNFDIEKSRLIDYIKKTQEFGESHFEQKESHSFGKLTATEWNNMFYKHLNHHLSQFGV
ncbi:DUF1569 domain-containing protein [Pedobacter immunditicola]|uniref:DUF1569 domain-containing protein n=1 Tax=Pedobacter immunditicola TaxID=3133440 RepID=UPI0030AB46D1